MATRLPADQAARDRVVTDLDTTLFVEAGAGTGKTTALVDRILRLFATGRAEAQHLAAITFTEKAAAELRDRLRRALEQAVAPTSALPSDEHQRCQVALEELDRAAICTLHAFARSILLSRPLEAGLPPLFTMQDDVQSSLAFADRWDAWLDDFLTDAANEALVHLALPLGLTPAHLRTMAEQFHQNWDRLEALPPPAAGLPSLPSVRAVLDPLEAACAQSGHCHDPADKMPPHLEEVRAYARRLQQAPAGAQRVRVLADTQRLSRNVGQAGNWTRGVLADIKRALTEAEQARTALLQELRSAVAPHVVEAMRTFALDWAAERRRQGALQFHDLLVLARDLLRDRPEVRAEITRKWSYLLIDEFQDTDPLQAEIAVLLTGLDVDAAGWQQAAVAPGRLFFVGDPKQSIYRFRRADVALYRAMQQRFTAGDVKLTENFRSQSTIIDWVNQVFARLLADGGDDVQAPYVPLTAAHAQADPRVTLLGEAVDADSVDQVRQQEAVSIAQAIQAVKAQGWPVTEKGDRDRPFRKARYADIAVLIPTRTSLPLLERALDDHEVPYRVESRSLVFATREVQDLLLVLTAIDDPTDQVALAGALRSPLFACSDNDLLSFKQLGGTWDYTHPQAAQLPADHPVVQAYAALGRLHGQRAWVGIAGVVEQVVDEREAFLLAFAHRRPRDVWNRLRFVVDQARAFQEQGGATLRQFVEWVQQQADEDRSIVETVVPEQDDDAVRIMTVHAAKGLEFPVVVLAGLNVEARSRPLPPALWADDGRVEVRLGSSLRPFETPGYESAKLREQQHQAAEQYRLLYVACTRARDHLLLSLWHKAGAGSHAATLYALRDEVRDLVRPLPAAVAPAMDLTDAVPATVGPDRDTWMAERQALLAAPPPRRPLAATAIAAAAQTDDKAEVVEELPPWRRGRAGTSIGRAVHSALQTVDLATGERAGEIAAAQAAAEGVAGRAAEVVRLVEAARRSPSVQAALASGRYWREVYVSAGVGDAVVEGFIDLLYETPDGLVVVDYKTDNLRTDADPATALGKYRLQGAAYALALQRTLGRPVARAVFVFVRTPDPMEVAVPDLAAAMAEVEQVVAASPSVTPL